MTIFYRLISFWVIFFFVLQTIHLYAQPPQFAQYSQKIIEAKDLSKQKKYKAAAKTYAAAFAFLGGKAEPNDRYNAACVWALAKNNDSAFLHLFRLAEVGKWSAYDYLLKDTDLNNLHKDKRWEQLCNKVKENNLLAAAEREKYENKPLKALLESVLETDQKYRGISDSMENKFGRESKECKDLWAMQNMLDSVNVVIVLSIIDKYGWLGQETVGALGNEALFFVIQHASIEVQERYLPIMKQAAKDNKASPSSLAMLEDRILVRNHKKQLYGSQITKDENGKFIVLPIEDEKNVDNRRLEVGLPPLSQYLQHYGIDYKLPNE